MITCAVIDDEPLAVKLLETYISKIDHLELVFSSSNPLEGLTKLSSNSVDLLFLDIQMPELTGMHVAKIIPKTIQVIFTTAYPEYAVEGFELKALDYLMKPITLHRFIEAIDRYKVQPSLKSSFRDQPKYIFVKSEYKQLKVDLSVILYIRGMGDYCQIICRSRKIMTLEKLDSFENRLPNHSFRRVHKSFLISLDKISYIEKGKVKIGDELIPVGQTYEKNIKDLLGLL